MIWSMILPPIRLFPGVVPITVSSFEILLSLLETFCPNILSIKTSPALFGSSILTDLRKLIRTVGNLQTKDSYKAKNTFLKQLFAENPHRDTTTPNTPSVGAACVEVGKFGLEEEVERLKRDKNVLMKELVRLRQQQEATDNQMQSVVQRLQGMEQRQQQMMSFLAKAVNSPGFLAQFVQQQEGSKKRRLKQDGIVSNGHNGSPDGQIVKYQPIGPELGQDDVVIDPNLFISEIGGFPLDDEMVDFENFLASSPDYSLSSDILKLEGSGPMDGYVMEGSGPNPNRGQVQQMGVVSSESKEA